MTPSSPTTGKNRSVSSPICTRHVCRRWRQKIEKRPVPKTRHPRPWTLELLSTSSVWVLELLVYVALTWVVSVRVYTSALVHYRRRIPGSNTHITAGFTFRTVTMQPFSLCFTDPELRVCSRWYTVSLNKDSPANRCIYPWELSLGFDFWRTPLWLLNFCILTSLYRTKAYHDSE